jgi:hypothetical protein
MPQLSAEAKHHILLEYAANDATRSFADLAARHAVKGGERVLRNSHQRWDGTPASLQHKRGAGRPRALNSTQVQLHVQFIDDTLAQAVEGLDRYPLTLVLDRAPIHTNVAAILQAFRDRGSGAIREIRLMPPNAAKRLSPLDNSLFHEWKEACRKRTPATKQNIEQIMNDAWANLNPGPYYKQCGLTRSKSAYFDCPTPADHQHDS